MGTYRQIERALPGDKILVVEDERELAEPLVTSLQEEGYRVTWAEGGAKALRLLDSEAWSLVVLDLMLPEVSGETVLGFINQKMDRPSVLVLTALGSMDKKLSLFRQGCDDYLVKPFVFDELLERVRALLRRPRQITSAACQLGDMVLDPETHRVVSPFGEVLLTPKEASILRLLIGASGKVVSRKEILQRVWGLCEETDTNFIGVHLFNLRKKLAEVGRENWLTTVRNSGFLLSTSGPEAYEP